MTEREIAEKMISDAEAMAKDGRAKLAELDKPKPKLRHGDYGTETGNSCGENHWIHLRGVTHWLTGKCILTSGRPDNSFVPDILGNINGDLKRNSKELEKFKIKDRHGDWTEISNEGDYVCIRVNDSIRTCSAQMPVDSITEIHQKLGQLIATAKRRLK